MGRRSGRGPRRTVVTVGMVVGAVIALAVLFLASAAVMDRLTTRRGEVVTAPIEDPVIVGGAGNEAHGSAAFEAVGDPAPTLPGGVWVTEFDVFEDEARAAASPGSATPETPSAPSPESEGPKADTGGATTPGFAGLAAAEGADDIARAATAMTRFVDLCAEGGSACPAGEPGTIVPYGGGLASPTLIKLWPGVTQSVLGPPKLRCNPGYHTSQSLPLVITTDRPVMNTTVTLELDGYGVLDSQTISAVPSGEWNRWAKRLELGKPVDASLDGGIQQCFRLATEGDPRNLQDPPPVVPPGAQYRITVTTWEVLNPTGAAAGDPDYDNGPGDNPNATVSYPRSTTFQKPPTIVSPVAGHTLQVVVPQIGPAQTVSVWAESTSTDGDCTTYGTAGGPIGTAEGYFASAYPSASPTKVTMPDAYPYDRAYDYQTIWNVSGLRSTKSYVLCVEWRSPALEHETWEVTPPRGFKVELDWHWSEPHWVPPLQNSGVPGYWSGQPYSYTMKVPTLLMTSTEPPSTCNVDQDTAGYCASLGLDVPPFTSVEMRRFDPETGQSKVIGEKTFATPEHCLPGGAYMLWPAGSFPIPCAPYETTGTVFGLKGTTLCGGPYGDGDCLKSQIESEVDVTIQGAPVSALTAPQSLIDWTIRLLASEYSGGPAGAGQALP